MDGAQLLNRDSSDDEELSTTASDSSQILVTYQYLAKHSHHDRYKDTAILIHTGSTCFVFHNKNMLSDVRKSRNKLRACTNGEHQDSTLVGDLPGFFQVWYNPSSMLNILAWCDVAGKYRITADTAIADVIHVHVSDDTVLTFKQVASGLFLLEDNTINDLVSNYSFLQVISTNKSNFTKRELAKADNGRTLYKNLGRLGYATMLGLLETNYIRNCPVTPDDLKRMLFIYGPDTALLMGKTARSRPSSIPVVVPLPLPPTVAELHTFVTLSFNYFFVQGIPFLHTISRDFFFRTCEPLRGKCKANKQDMLMGLSSVPSLYHSLGLTVSQINCDYEFPCVRNSFFPIAFNVVAAVEYVGDVERSIRTSKQDTRSLIHDLPFSSYPREMIIGAVVSAMSKRNSLPNLRGISPHLSQNSLVTGEAPLITTLSLPWTLVTMHIPMKVLPTRWNLALNLQFPSIPPGTLLGDDFSYPFSPANPSIIASTPSYQPGTMLLRVCIP